MAARNDVDAPPEEFRKALDQLRAARLRPEIFCEEMPAPQRIAPYSAAMTADVTVGGEDVGGGRLVLLYDPAGNDAWQGDVPVRGLRARRHRPRDGDRPAARRGRLDLADRGAHGARRRVPRPERHRHPGGVGELRRHGRRPPAPRSRCAPPGRRSGPSTPHVEAWGDLLCTAAGLPPVPAGVVAMPNRRGQRSR